MDMILAMLILVVIMKQGFADRRHKRDLLSYNRHQNILYAHAQTYGTQGLNLNLKSMTQKSEF